MAEKKFVEPVNARPGTQYENVINQIHADGVCPFCPEQLLKYHKNPITTEGTYWKVTNNMYPYKPTTHHILFIHKEHITHMSEMSAEAWKELGTLYIQETRRENITGGTLMLRFGDTFFTGASVSHLHAHLIQSNPDDPSYKEMKHMPGVIARIG